ncbi:hypothetical protein DENSPDRAFT_308688 [Dentipellis sp. KUC8613]|nr:hypothetical protein DENSPDRAFT_308688 [Dentipellis sp. KUC8613]
MLTGSAHNRRWLRFSLCSACPRLSSPSKRCTHCHRMDLEKRKTYRPRLSLLRNDLKKTTMRYFTVR